MNPGCEHRAEKSEAFSERLCSFEKSELDGTSANWPFHVYGA